MRKPTAQTNNFKSILPINKAQREQLFTQLKQADAQKLTYEDTLPRWGYGQQEVFAGSIMTKFLLGY